MSIDLQSRGAAFKRQIMAEAREMMVGLLNTVNATVAAQDDGVGVSNQHRVLNFLGPGVAVTDDAVNRRANVYIPGVPAGSTSISVASAPGNERAFDNGTSATGPTGWQVSSFNHAGTGWANSIADTNAGMPSAPVGSAYVCRTTANAPDNERHLFWRSVSVPAGTIISASLTFIEDNTTEGIWINGTRVYTGTTDDLSTVTIPIDPSLLGAGAANDLALQVLNTPALPPNVGFNWIRIAYRLDLVVGQALGLPYVNVQDQKSSGTAAGTFTSGSYQTRTLNTIAFDTTGTASLASNQITLPAGTYRCYISCPAIFVVRHKARLQNVTDGVTLLAGSAEAAQAAGTQTRSIIAGRFTLSASKALEVQHRCSSTEATDGFGFPSSFGDVETYTIAEFWKEA